MDGMMTAVPLPWIDPAKPQLRKIKLLDEDINYPNRIVLVDPVLQAFQKQRRLTPIYPINEALHSIPRESSGNHIPSLRRFHTARVMSADSALFAACPLSP